MTATDTLTATGTIRAQRTAPDPLSMADLPPGETRELLAQYDELSARKSKVLRAHGAELRKQYPELPEEAKEELAVRAKAGIRAEAALSSQNDFTPRQKSALRTAAVQGKKCGRQLEAALHNLMVLQVNDHIHKIPGHKKHEVRSQMLDGARMQLSIGVERYDKAKGVPFTRYVTSVVRSNLKQMLHQVVDDGLVVRPLEATLVSRRAFVIMKEMEADAKIALRDGLIDRLPTHSELIADATQHLKDESNAYTYNRLPADPDMTEEEKWELAEAKNRKSGRMGHIDRLDHTVQASRSETTLDAVVSEDDESTLMSLLADDKDESQSAMGRSVVEELLESMLSHVVDPQGRYIVSSLYGLDPMSKKKTYTALASELGTTVTKVKAAASEAMSVVRMTSEAKDLARLNLMDADAAC